MKIGVKINGIDTNVDIDLVPTEADGRPIKNLLDTMTDGVYDVDTVEEAKLATEDARAELKKSRDEALSDSQYVLPDGAIYQTRPSDLSNFEIAINKGVDKNWILKDNSVRLTTVAELVEILTNGISQAEAIWDNYAEELGKL